MVVETEKDGHGETCLDASFLRPYRDCNRNRKRSSTSREIYKDESEVQARLPITYESIYTSFSRCSHTLLAYNLRLSWRGCDILIAAKHKSLDSHEPVSFSFCRRILRSRIVYPIDNLIASAPVFVSPEDREGSTVTGWRMNAMIASRPKCTNGVSYNSISAMRRTYIIRPAIKCQTSRSNVLAQ